MTSSKKKHGCSGGMFCLRAKIFNWTPKESIYAKKNPRHTQMQATTIWDQTFRYFSGAKWRFFSDTFDAISQKRLKISTWGKNQLIQRKILYKIGWSYFWPFCTPSALIWAIALLVLKVYRFIFLCLVNKADDSSTRDGIF